MNMINKAVDKNRSLILEAERYIWNHPETGYKEVETCKYLAEKFEELGYELTYAENVPGFYTLFDTGKKGPTILILGEMDSLIIPTHKECDPKTGAVHACGHNAQSATLLGIAASLKEKGVTDGMCGKIKLCAVPAEEMIEIEYRKELKDQGVIKFYCGKTEFLSRGYFDDVDIAFMVHTARSTFVRLGSIGVVAKKVVYKGLASHAGTSPWLGRNALYAANCGINAANALRETFQESDLIRFHPIITAGGSAVNAIPDQVKVEAFVRGKTFDAIKKANRKINQALIGGALSLNNNIEINDFIASAPLLNDLNLIKVAKEAADIIIPEENFTVNEVIGTGSTDMGDLSCVMPVINLYIDGAGGLSHGDNYQIIDAEKACVKSAKWQIYILKLLLSDNGVRAENIKQKAKIPFASRNEYIDFILSFEESDKGIEYTENGAKINLD